MPKMNFDGKRAGLRLKHLRKEQEYSIVKLAESAEVDKNTVYRAEKDAKTVNPESLWRICEVLGISPFDLIGRKLQEDVDFKVVKHVSKESWKSRQDDKHLKPFDIGRLPHGSFWGTMLYITGDTRPRSHMGEEMVLCLTGGVVVKVGSVEICLGPNDAAFFYGSEVHSYHLDKNVKDAIVLSVWAIDPDETDEESKKSIKFHGEVRSVEN